jgi:hypothetical protein
MTEVPDVDRLEQTIPAVPDEEDEQEDLSSVAPASVAPDDDVPEADAVEQSIPVPLEDDH